MDVENEQMIDASVEEPTPERLNRFSGVENRQRSKSVLISTKIENQNNFPNLSHLLPLLTMQTII